MKRRKDIALRYEKILKAKNIKFQSVSVKGKRVYYRFVITDKKVKQIRDHMGKGSIETIIPIEKWELLHRYLGININKFYNAEQISKTTLSIPIYPALRENELRIIERGLKGI